jgi:hypothetical protein
MTRRKGELSPAGIDRGWPHQIVLPADECRGTQYQTIHAFCRDLSLCSRRHSLFWDDRCWQVFCFSDAAHAEQFRARFGGERFDPKERGRGRSWARWRR